MREPQPVPRRGSKTLTGATNRRADRRHKPTTQLILLFVCCLPCDERNAREFARRLDRCNFSGGRRYSLQFVWHRCCCHIISNASPLSPTPRHGSQCVCWRSPLSRVCACIRMYEFGRCAVRCLSSVSVWPGSSCGGSPRSFMERRPAASFTSNATLQLLFA